MSRYPPAPIATRSKWDSVEKPLSNWSLEKIRSLEITPDTIEPLIGELYQLGTRFIVDKLKLIDRAQTRGNGKAILVLGFCTKSNESTGNLDEPSCVTERSLSALEMPGGPSVVFFDLRQDCIRYKPKGTETESCLECGRRDEF
jgi:hypothetical protein